MAQFDEFFIEFEKVLSLGLTLLFRDEDREDSGLNLSTFFGECLVLGDGFNSVG